MFTDQQIADFAHQLEAKGAPPEKIEAFVKSAKADQSAGQTTSQPTPKPSVLDWAAKAIPKVTMETLSKPHPQEIPETPKEKGIIESGLDLLQLPIKGAANVASQAVSGAGKVVGGLAEGAQALNPISGESFEQRSERMKKGFMSAAEGGLQAVASPVTGLVETLPAVPGGKEVKGVAEGVMNIPNVAVGNLAKTFIPAIVEKFGGKIDPNSPQFEEDVVKPLQLALGYGTLAAAPSMEKGINKITEKAGKMFKKGGEEAFSAAFPPSTKEAALMQQEAVGQIPSVRTTAQSAFETPVKGITKKTIGDSALREANNLFKKDINPILETSEKTVNIHEKLSEIAKDIEKEIEPGRQKELKAGLDALKEDYAEGKYRNVTMPDVQALKSGLDQFTPQKIFKGEDVANGYRQVKAFLADKLRSSIYDLMPNNKLREKYLDYANLKQLSDAGIQARTAGKLSGGFGGFFSTLIRSGLAPFSMKGGKILYKLGDTMYRIKTSPDGNIIFAPVISGAAGNNEEK